MNSRNEIIKKFLEHKTQDQFPKQKCVYTKNRQVFGDNTFMVSLDSNDFVSTIHSIWLSNVITKAINSRQKEVNKVIDKILPMVKDELYKPFTKTVVKIKDNSFLTKIESNGKVLYLLNEYGSMIETLLNDTKDNINCYVFEGNNCVFFKNNNGSKVIICGVKLI